MNIPSKIKNALTSVLAVLCYVVLACIVIGVIVSSLHSRRQLNVCFELVPRLSAADAPRCIALVGSSGDVLVLDGSAASAGRSGTFWNVTINGTDVPASSIENRIYVVLP